MSGYVCNKGQMRQFIDGNSVLDSVELAKNKENSYDRKCTVSRVKDNTLFNLLTIEYYGLKRLYVSTCK